MHYVRVCLSINVTTYYYFMVLRQFWRLGDYTIVEKTYITQYKNYAGYADSPIRFLWLNNDGLAALSLSCTCPLKATDFQLISGFFRSLYLAGFTPAQSL